MSNSPRMPRWQEQDFIDLAILYHMGISLDQMEKVLQRSKQAIDKQLSRVGIRPTKDKYKVFKPNLYFSSPVKPEIIKTSMDLYRAKYHDYLHGTTLNTALSFLQKMMPFHISYRTRGKRLTIKSTTPPALEQWVTTKGIIAYLKMHGYRIREMEMQPLCQAGFTFMVNGQAATNAQILKLANTLREKYQTPRFYLEGLTE